MAGPSYKGWYTESMQGEAKEEIRSRLAIEDVIGEYVELKRAGRNFKGLSPFSGEKTPSFFVSPDKNIWHDFSSNKGGDVFSFVMEVEGMDFRQALEHLARKAGVDLSMYETKGSQELARRKKRAYEAHDWAAKYYQQCLLRSQRAMKYVFERRGLSKQVVTDFLIGYAPDSGQALTTALSKKGFTKKELADAGLTNRFGGDMFRGRVMIPLMDPSGQVIGFTGRIIEDVEGAPKYLNTPQTIIYDKGRHIFGLSQAKEAVRLTDYIVMVEGNLDVVSSHQAGVRQVVATAGTAMTEHHLRAVKRLVGDVRLAYDGDKAGIAATERAIGLGSQVGVELTVVSLPDGAKDPDELIQQDVALWRQAIDARQPAVDWVLDQYRARVDITTASGKRAFTNAGLAIVRSLHDAVERDHYERKIAEMTGTSLSAVQAKSHDTKQATPQLRPIKQASAVDLTPDYSIEDSLLALTAIDVPSQELLTHLQFDLLHGEERQALARYLAAHRGQVLVDTPDDLQKYDTYVKIVLLRADTRYAEWDGNDRYFETARLLRQIEHEDKKQTRDILITELRNAEEADDETKADDLRRQLNLLIKEIARGKR